jgi:hypothetical protein
VIDVRSPTNERYSRKQRRAKWSQDWLHSLSRELLRKDRNLDRDLSEKTVIRKDNKLSPSEMTPEERLDEILDLFNEIAVDAMLKENEISTADGELCCSAI